MSEQPPVQYEIPFPESFDLISTDDGQAIAIDLHTLDPKNAKAVEVRAWLTLRQAALLSARLARICKQFGVEPTAGQETSH